MKEGKTDCVTLKCHIKCRAMSLQWSKWSYNNNELQQQIKNVKEKVKEKNNETKYLQRNTNKK